MTMARTVFGVLSALCILIVSTSASAQSAVERKKVFLFDDIALYPWSGFMGSGNGSSITLNLYDAIDPYDGLYSARISASGREQWCGIVVQCRDKWWSPPGVDLSGVQSVSFAVRGQNAGADITFKFMNEQYEQKVVLSKNWQQITVPFTGAHDFTSIYSLFLFVVSGSRPVEFNLDEIYFEADRPDGATIPSVPRLVRGVGYNQIDAGKYSSDFSMIRNTMCANSLRFWGATDFSVNTLDKMAAHGLTAFLPYWMPRGDDNLRADYTDAGLRSAIKRSVLNYLKFYYPHPSLMGVSLGNEVFKSLTPDTPENKAAFAQFLNELCVDLHTLYPDIKVSYAAAGTEALPLLKAHAPCLDIYGSNAYGDIGSVMSDYGNSGYKKPLLLFEYGCFGWWEKDWSKYPNQERAKDYLAHWNRLKGASLGGYAFTWLDKSENGYTGWGIVEADRTPRPQFTALAEAYRLVQTDLPWLLLLTSD